MKRILVVDDNKMNCMTVKLALGNTYEVIAVNSGKEAFDFLEKETVDLILLDIKMPEMSGKEVAQKLKAHEEWCKIPFVFLTADADPRTEIECLNLGADDFITKPFVPLVIHKRVSRILEVYELRASLENQLEKKKQQVETVTLKSFTDALTGLHNREYLEKTLQELLDNGQTGTLFMIDLDDFKKMNDTYGHIVGDKVLQYFAEVLKEYARKEDIVCRLAGDEFVTYYPELKKKSTVAKKAKKIIRTFAEKMGAHGYGGIVSVSIGIVIAQEGEEFISLYNKADKALYSVKNNGKNAYRFYDDHNTREQEISTLVDLQHVSNMIEQGLTEKKGAYQLAYDEFKNVYDFISRCVARKKQDVQVVLFTMDLIDGQTDKSMEVIMQLWEHSLESSLRFVDTGTRYSSSQYIAIFLDADYDNGKLVAERVIEKFYEINSDLRTEVKITYDIQTMKPAFGP